MRRKNPWFWFLGILVLLTLVVWTGREEIATSFHDFPWSLLPAFLILQIVTLTLTSYCWFLLLKEKGSSIPFMPTLLIFLSGNFVESVTPVAKLGGEAAKVFLFRKKANLEYSAVLSVLMVQKIFFFLSFFSVIIVIVIPAAFFYPLPPELYQGIVVLGAILTLAIFFLKRKSMGKRKGSGWAGKFRDFFQQTLQETHLKGRFSLYIISLLIWALYPVKTYAVTLALDMEASFLLIALATFAAYLLGMIPLLPGGLGAFKGGMAFFLSLGALSIQDGLSIALITRIITFWFPLLFGALATAFLGGISEKR